MNQKLVTKKIIIIKDDVVEHFDTALLVMSPNTIHYNNKTILLKNVTNLLKSECIKVSQKGLFLSNKLINHIYKAIFYTSLVLILLNMQASLGARIDKTMIQTVVWFNKADLFIISNILVAILIFAILALLYSFYERNYKSVKVHYFGLLIETKTGQSEGLFVKDKAFIETLFESITQALNDPNFVELIIDFNTTEIKYIDTKTQQIPGISLKKVGKKSLAYN